MHKYTLDYFQTRSDIFQWLELDIRIDYRAPSVPLVNEIRIRDSLDIIAKSFKQE